PTNRARPNNLLERIPNILLPNFYSYFSDPTRKRQYHRRDIRWHNRQNRIHQFRRHEYAYYDYKNYRGITLFQDRIVPGQLSYFPQPYVKSQQPGCQDTSRPLAK